MILNFFLNNYKIPRTRRNKHIKTATKQKMTGACWGSCCAQQEPRCKTTKIRLSCIRSGTMQGDTKRAINNNQRPA